MKQFLLSWSEPTTGGEPSDYIIQYKTAEQDWTTYIDNIDTSTSGLVSGLDQCAFYSFRVAAKNIAGTGPYSNTVSGSILSDAPSYPVDLTGVAGHHKIVLSWTEPNNGGCDIQDYIIEYYKNNDESTYIRAGGSDNKYILFNLVNHEPYTIRVAAINKVGTGLYSSNIICTPLEKPPTITNFYAYAESDERIGLTWTEPYGTYDSYVVEYSDPNTIWTTLATLNSGINYLEISTLQPNITYTFKITAKNQTLLGDSTQQVLAFILPRDSLYNKTRLLLRMGDLL